MISEAMWGCDLDLQIIIRMSKEYWEAPHDSLCQKLQNLLMPEVM